MQQVDEQRRQEQNVALAVRNLTLALESLAQRLYLHIGEADVTLLTGMCEHSLSLIEEYLGNDRSKTTDTL